MNKKKRSTAFGAALIILGLLALVVGKLRHGQEGPLLRLPQGGLTRPSRTEPTVPAGPAADAWTFSAADGELISLQYGDGCSYRPDILSLLQRPLQWQLREETPTVLIIHTHGSESYTPQPGQDYVPAGDYRTLDTDHNLIALGDRLTALLEAAGIRVLHDRTLHDYPSYNSSYDNSRAAAQEYLRQHPGIRLVLDLHRDAVLLSDGSQFAPTVTVGGERVARLMLVVGSDGSGMDHPHWQENLASALKLQALLEKQVPGITRPTMLRAQRFNHDLAPGAMIVEIGAAGNTLQQAMAAVPYLAEAIIDLSDGTTANSTS